MGGRIWRREGPKVPLKQRQRGRLWLNPSRGCAAQTHCRAADGSCGRLRPEHPNPVWPHDVVQDRTHDRRACRTLTIIDAFTREALMIRVDRKLNPTDVADALTDLFIPRGPPRFIGSDNGPGFVAPKVRDRLPTAGARTAFIEPGSPWENGYCEGFNARFRDELLNGEVFYSLREAQILIEQWRIHQTPSGRTTVRDTGRRPPGPSFQRTRDRPCPNNQTGPPNGGAPRPI